MLNKISSIRVSLVALVLLGGAFYACGSDDGETTGPTASGTAGSGGEGGTTSGTGGEAGTTSGTGGEAGTTSGTGGATGGSTGSGGDAGGPIGGGGGGSGSNLCTGHAGQLFCQSNVAINCNYLEQLVGVEVCGDEYCVPGLGCQLCLAGQYHCEGNEVMQCSAGPPATWVSLSPQTICSATAGYKCNATTGTCQVLQPIGSLTVTGYYYQYANFTTSNSPFLGGCDVDSYGDKIYVNRGAWYQDGQWMDVYQVQLLDSDGDGLMEPNQHPDNTDDLGPIEQRVLTYVETYHVPELGIVHRSESFVVNDRAYFVSGSVYPGYIFEYIFATGVTNAIANAPVPAVNNSFLGYGSVDGKWYAGHEGGRRVYSYHPPTNSWVAEFEYPSLAGGHFDGMEVVVDPNTGFQYVYVSDMTSDYLGQYRFDEATGQWIQENVFQYYGTVSYVEGMGFGALNHFWFTGSGAELYEIGGGDLTEYLEN